MLQTNGRGIGEQLGKVRIGEARAALGLVLGVNYGSRPSALVPVQVGLHGNGSDEIEVTAILRPAAPTIGAKLGHERCRDKVFAK